MLVYWIAIVSSPEVDTDSFLTSREIILVQTIVLIKILDHAHSDISCMGMIRDLRWSLFLN